jgi:hypothetical protein
MADREASARLYRNARREAIIVMIVWTLALLWTVGYCYLRGYQHPENSWLVQSGLAADRTQDNFHEYAGLPDWVLFGIICPWLVCTAFTIFFCLFLMKDDDLGAEAEEGAGHEH